MANELRHKDVGNQLSKSEWEAIGTHIFNNQATGDIPYASSATQISRLGIGAVQTILTVTGGVPVWTATPTLTGLTIGASDLAIGANLIKTTNLAIKEDDANTISIRNAADDDYKRLKLDILFPEQIQGAIDGAVIAAFNADGNYLTFKARLTGTGLREVARLQGAAAPRFQHTAPINYGAEQDHTIAAGVITIVHNSGFISVIVAGGTGSGNDDLDTINGGAEGDLIVLKANTSGVLDTVTVTEAGNIILDAAGNFVMDHVNDRIMLIYDGASWCEISRSNNA